MRTYVFKVFNTCVFIIVFLLTATIVSGQRIGDYRTQGSGNWNDNSNWEYFGLFGWEAAGIAPGLAPNGNPKVTISEGDIININASNNNVSYHLSQLHIYGQLNLSGGKNIFLENTTELIVDGGTLQWMDNNTELHVDENTVVLIINLDCTTNTEGVCQNCSNGLQATNENNTRRFYIGSIAYAAATGVGNVNYLFRELNCAGGALWADIKAEPEIICSGENVIITISAGGVIRDKEKNEVATYELSATGPETFNFDTLYFDNLDELQENNLKTLSLIEPGDYNFKLTAQKPMPHGPDYYTTDSVIISVNPLPVFESAEQNLVDPVENGKPAIIDLEGLYPNTDFIVYYNINNGTMLSASVYTDDEGKASFSTVNLFDWLHHGKVLNILSVENSDTFCSQNIDFSIPLNVTGGWPLPVELIDFNAYCNYDNTRVTWTTATEINNDFFILERSSDMINFDKIAKINGNGFSNTNIDYDYIDNKPYPGINYYRLTQVDFDGTYEVFNPIATHCNLTDINNKRPVIFPNPARNVINVKMELTDNQFVYFEIYDETGKMLVRKEKSTIDNFTEYQINIDNLNDGVYFLRIISGTNIFSEQIIKIR